MKKLICTVTAISFVLGLTGAGIAQTAAKEADKPAVKMETKTGQSQVAPQSTEKAAEPAANPVTADVGKVWTRMLPEGQYLYADAGAGEKPAAYWSAEFPHALKAKGGAPDAQFFEAWESSPFSDDYLGRMAAASVDALKLGQGTGTDFLGISFQGQGQGQEQGQMAPGADSPGGFGQVLDAPGSSPAELEQLRQEVIINVIRAAEIAKSQGKGSGHLADYVSSHRKPKVCWQELLRDYLTSFASDDYDWNVPNNRYLSQGVYLPSLRSERCGTIAVAIDTSGSIGRNEFEAFVSELRDILTTMRPEKIILVQCESSVQDYRVIESTDDLDEKVKLCGGGGTSFCPVFERIETENETPQVLVFFTDGYGTYPATAPSSPVLWMMTTTQVAKFGTTIKIDLYTFASAE